jgi:hypothetical protein
MFATIQPIESFAVEALHGKDRNGVLIYINVGVTMLHERGAGKLPRGSARRHQTAQNTADACRIAIEQRAHEFKDHERDEIMRAWVYASQQIASNLAAQVKYNNG